MDVLADRKVETVTTWLTGHAGDLPATAAALMEAAARAGAPDSIEVADLWHLWRDLPKAVEAIINEKRELVPEPSIERTMSEQLAIVAQQVHATHQESSILAVRTKRRFEAIFDRFAEGAAPPSTPKCRKCSELPRGRCGIPTAPR
ncbi:hypothetical protein XU06_29435 (plasmid) [Rhodococcus erythropolis]|nr:hypothetical protein XU06_29435 [Rhodococcus erythropolis]